MTPQIDTSARKIIQLISANKKTVAIFDSNYKDPSEIFDGPEEQLDDEFFSLGTGELYVPVELWALVEYENGSRSILGATAEDIPSGSFCTDAVNFLRYVTLKG